MWAAASASSTGSSRVVRQRVRRPQHACCIGRVARVEAGVEPRKRKRGVAARVPHEQREEGGAQAQVNGEEVRGVALNDEPPDAQRVVVYSLSLFFPQTVTHVPLAWCTPGQPVDYSVDGGYHHGIGT